MIHITDENTSEIFYGGGVSAVSINRKVVWGTYKTETMIVAGLSFKNKRNALLKSRSFNRSEQPPNTGISVIDISSVQDGSIVIWYDASAGVQYWYSDCDVIYMNPDSHMLFSGDSTLTSIDLTNWDSSRVTTMSDMFSNCKTLTTVNNISTWDTSNTTNMYRAFIDTGFKSLDLTNWNTSRVTNMQYMLSGCPNLSNIVYGPNFVNSALPNMGVYNNTNGSAYMINVSPLANTPPWTGGYWTHGTFVKNK